MESLATQEAAFKAVLDPKFPTPAIQKWKLDKLQAFF